MNLEPLEHALGRLSERDARFLGRLAAATGHRYYHRADEEPDGPSWRAIANVLHVFACAVLDEGDRQRLTLDALDPDVVESGEIITRDEMQKLLDEFNREEGSP